MSIGASAFLIAVGAILKFALETSVKGINLGLVGVILMIVGAVGLIVSMLFWSSFSPYRRRTDVVESTVVTREREVL